MSTTDYNFHNNAAALIIAAALSGDENMMADFATGDPYTAVGIRAGLLPEDSGVTGARDMIKAYVLGVQYGYGLPRF